MNTGAGAAAQASPAPPAVLLNEVDERCRALAATAVGRTYTVPAGAAEADLGTEARRGARYDTVLSFMCTPGVASLTDYIAAIERVLADEGWILMVEPAWLDRGTLREWLAARRRRGCPPRRAKGKDLVSAVRSHYPRLDPVPGRGAKGQDLVSAVRSRGLVLTDVHRCEAPSVPPAWRQYVVLRARRPSPGAAGP